MKKRYTVFGHSGFVGGELVKHLSGSGVQDIFLPARNTFPDPGENLGHVIYCIGLTADFRKYPLETVEAHVTKLMGILRPLNFESFVYLSSTRVYQKIGVDPVVETCDIVTNPEDFSDLYNISKIMGESVCLSYKNPKIKIARLSNVIGADFFSDNFLTQILKEAVEKKSVTLKSHPDSAKDYVSIEDVVRILPELHAGKHPIYNVAGGENVSTGTLLAELRKSLSFETKGGVELPKFHFPCIDISRLRNEFGFQPASILQKLNQIVKSYPHENNH